MKLPGVPDGGYGHLGAGAGAGGHLGDGHSIWSSSGGPDEAIDTPTMTVGRQEGPNWLRDLIPFLYRLLLNLMKWGKSNFEGDILCVLRT